MPWLSIVLAILTFFMSGGSKKENRAKALLTASAVGLGTYAVSHYTDWGQRNLGSLDGVTLTTDPTTGETILKNPDGSTSVVTTPVGSTPANSNTSGAGSNGFWSTFSGWLSTPAGQVTSGAAGASAVLGGVPKWVLWSGIGLVVYSLLKG